MEIFCENQYIYRYILFILLNYWKVRFFSSGWLWPRGSSWHGLRSLECTRTINITVPPRCYGDPLVAMESPTDCHGRASVLCRSPVVIVVTALTSRIRLCQGGSAWLESQLVTLYGNIPPKIWWSDWEFNYDRLAVVPISDIGYTHSSAGNILARYSLDNTFLFILIRIILGKNDKLLAIPCNVGRLS